MALILAIDTSVDTALVCLSRGGVLLAERSNSLQKDHAAFVQPAIAALLAEAGADFGSLDAVAVASGPGSYTGLRVGMASAKGLAYALGLPLITVGTLRLMAASAKAAVSGAAAGTRFCPMIDARRMEVFTALYSFGLDELEPPSALILEANSFETALQNGPVCFTGNGAAKWKAICTHKHAFFENTNISPAVFSQICFQLFENQLFADTAYAEPEYAKPFYTTQKRQAQ